MAGAHATKFNTPADFVRAYDEAIKSSAFQRFVNNAADTTLTIDDLRADNVYGSAFRSRLKGYDTSGIQTILGSDTKILAIFRKDSNGIPQLLTMYTNP